VAEEVRAYLGEACPGLELAERSFGMDGVGCGRSAKGKGWGPRRRCERGVLVVDAMVSVSVAVSRRRRGRPRWRITDGNTD